MTSKLLAANDLTFYSSQITFATKKALASNLKKKLRNIEGETFQKEIALWRGSFPTVLKL